MAHNYSNTASKAVLDAPLNSSANTFAVTDFTGYPSAPFWVLMDRDTSSAELMEVTGVAGSTLTVLRGAGGTASTSHSAGAAVEHVIPALVPQQSEQHVEATTNIHGVTGTLIGSDSTGTLSNKTFQGAFVHNYSNSEPESPAGGFVINADNSVGRDGFIVNNTGANNDRAGFVLRQAGSDRFKVYNDGTVLVNPSGASARPAIATSGTVQAEDLTVNDDVTVGGDVTATGTVTAASANFGNLNLSGNLTSTDQTTLGTVNAAGVVTASAPGTALVVNNTAQVGTLNVTGGNVVLSATNARLQLPSSASGNGTAAGQVRYRGGQIETWDGSSWRGMMSTAAASSGGFSGVTSTANKQLFTTTLTDPGYPYFVFASGQAEFNDVAGGDRWDLVICLDSLSSSDYIATAVGNGFVQTSAVSNFLTGTHTLYWVARRTLGGGSVNVTGFNSNYSVAQIAAVIRPT